MKTITFILFLFLIAGIQTGFGQLKDSTALPKTKAVSATRKVVSDSIVKKPHDPHKATMRSAILPGWGQAYNRSYWKIPIVYGALGITGAVFNFNRVQYNKIKFAYFTLINKDTANYKNVDQYLQKFVYAGDQYALQSGRTEARKNIDYSVLFFIVFWGLNVVDATVDGHLKEFDVSNNLSLKIKPVFNTFPGSAGISLVFNIGRNSHYYNNKTRLVP